uniref:Putative secreted protein n=1 Tax=Ixodes ricinus TaxID=34613 RepID=A0A6B0UBA3_IXORI
MWRRWWGASPRCAGWFPTTANANCWGARTCSASSSAPTGPCLGTSSAKPPTSGPPSAFTARDCSGDSLNKASSAKSVASMLTSTAGSRC